MPVKANWTQHVSTSVSNSSKPQERFRVRIGTGTKLLQLALPHENLDSCNLAAFSTKNQQFIINTLATMKYLSSDRIMT
jgi:hypothetical protein